jgi:hypothetical protein
LRAEQLIEISLSWNNIGSTRPIRKFRFPKLKYLNIGTLLLILRKIKLKVSLKILQRAIFQSWEKFVWKVSGTNGVIQEIATDLQYAGSVGREVGISSCLLIILFELIEDTTRKTSSDTQRKISQFENI